MKTRILNYTLLAALLACVVLNFALRQDYSRPNRLFLPDMAYSPAYKAFATNPAFADGQTLQSPVPGTVARGYLPLHYQPTPADALRAGEELSNPVAPADATVLARGAAVFSYFCQPCHGAGAAGNGTVVMRGFPAPPSLLAPRALNMKDGQMFHVLTYGQNNMPSYASQVSREDRWKVILYIRSLQKQAQK